MYRAVIAEYFNGHIGEANKGDEEVLDKQQ